jgi:hypothetical protein
MWRERALNTRSVIQRGILPKIFQIMFTRHGWSLYPIEPGSEGHELGTMIGQDLQRIPCYCPAPN